MVTIRNMKSRKDVKELLDNFPYVGSWKIGSLFRQATTKVKLYNTPEVLETIKISLEIYLQNDY
jgi:hypothetical protein